VPGETARQWQVFLIWACCLLAAVVVVVVRRPDAPSSLRDSHAHEEQLRVWQSERVRIAVGLGLALPGLLTWWATHRRRRGGGHARGIVVDVTDDGELRIWGRGYGERAHLEGAEIDERLVDIYSGRLGAWRQRRMRIRARRASGARLGVLEIGTPAVDGDEDLDLRLEGGEGDCVELDRDDYLAVLQRARTLAAEPPA
jgi:hypothetical protein